MVDTLPKLIDTLPYLGTSKISTVGKTGARVSSDQTRGGCNCTTKTMSAPPPPPPPFSDDLLDDAQGFLDDEEDM